MSFSRECETLRKDLKIVLQEKRCKITFNNVSRNTVRQVEIDGCVIKNGKRCDWLLITIDSTEHYIELKGCDIKRAVKQIERTIIIVSEDAIKLKKHSFIISTRCPIMSTEIQNIKYRFKKKYNSSFIVKNNYYEHNL